MARRQAEIHHHENANDSLLSFFMVGVIQTSIIKTISQHFNGLHHARTCRYIWRINHPPLSEWIRCQTRLPRRKWMGSEGGGFLGGRWGWPLPNIYQVSSDVPNLNYWLLYWIIFWIRELHLSLTLHTLILAWKLHWNNVEITWIKSIRWTAAAAKSLQ